MTDATLFPEQEPGWEPCPNRDLGDPCVIITPSATCADRRDYEFCRRCGYETRWGEDGFRRRPVEGVGG